MENMSNTTSNDTYGQSNDQYNNQSVKNIIAKVIGVENSAAWEVVSSDPDHNLYMVHHKPEANLSEYGQIRGLVIDIKAETIICKSYGYTPTIVTDKITIQAGDGNVHLIDELGLEHALNPARMLLKIGFEGTLINVFKHDGVVYRSTRKRLDANRSRWGSSKTFMEMYETLGGPGDELFNSNSDYSPYCHTFIIVHPDVLVVTKDNVGDGYLVYLGPKQMWSTDYETCPYKQTRQDGKLYEGVSQEDFDNDPRPNAGWIDDTLHVPQTFASIENLGKTVLAPPDLSFDQANKHLKFGFYNSFEGFEKLDKRMLPGEFVVIHNLDENGATTGLIRVESPAYNWRAGMRDNNPNLRHRFFQLVNGSYLRYDTAEGRDRYNSLYPTFTPYEALSIKKQISTDGPYVVWPQDVSGSEPDLNDRDARMYNIWLAFLNAVPLHQQYDVITYLDYLYSKRGELISWLRTLENRGHIDPTVFSGRVVNIIETSRRFAQQKVTSGQDRGKDGRKLSVKDITKDNVRNLVMKEEGSSLYRLIREMDQYKQEQTK